MPDTSRAAAVKPLTALLSQAFVAFAIECDNAFEERVRHRTTIGGATGDRSLPWLVSIGMWALYLRHIDSDGIPIREFARRAGLSGETVRTVLVRMHRWWCYVDIEPPARGAVTAKSNLIVRPARGAARAWTVWRTLPEEIERRWSDRFGREHVAALRRELEAISDVIHACDPYVPIGNHGMFVHDGRKGETFSPPSPLYALFAGLPVAAARDIERDALLSMAIADNVVRAIAEGERPVRELVLATGCSSRAIASSLTYLREQHLAVEGRCGRSRTVGLTPEGRAAWETFEKRRGAIERDWCDRAGTKRVGRLRSLLEATLDARDGAASLLGSGIAPAAGSWRTLGEYRRQTEAFVDDPAGALPHFPFVAHRGAWPDGS
jgi:predicted transcriptional regulator